MTGEELQEKIVKAEKIEELSQALAKVQVQIFIQKFKFKRGFKNMIVERFNPQEAVEKLEGLYIDRNILKKKLHDI